LKPVRLPTGSWQTATLTLEGMGWPILWDRSDSNPRLPSHDWHVQPSCQRPNRIPPERRAFSPGDRHRSANRLSSKLVRKTCPSY